MFLLDTHILLWLLSDPRKLSKELVATLEETKERVYVSPASTWEIAIKISLGKLSASLPKIIEELSTLSFEELPIRHRHTLDIEKLPHLHRDPFDRILISQARVEKLKLITTDPSIHKYDVETFWI